MRIETVPLTFPPYQCMVTGRDDGEIINFDVDVLPLADGDVPRLQIKKDVVEEAAREYCDMASRKEVEELREQVERWGAEVTAALDALSIHAEFEDTFAN